MDREKYQSINDDFTSNGGSVLSNRVPQRDHILEMLEVYAKATGLLYSVIIGCGMVSELGVRGVLINFGSPEETASNVAEFPVLFRSGLALDLIMCCADVCVAVLLAFILIQAGANVVLSVVASAFRFIQSAIISVNLLHMFVASILLDSSVPTSLVIASSSLKPGEEYPDLGKDLAFLFLVIHKYGYLLALVFFGLSMSFFGAIILSNGVFPKWLGVFVFMAGLGYILDSGLFFLNSGYNGEATNILMLPALVAEFGLAIWLLCCQPSRARVFNGAQTSETSN